MICHAACDHLCPCRSFLNNSFFSCKDRALERDRPYQRKKNKGRALLLAPSPVQASGQVALLPAANGLQLPPMWAGGPPSGLDLTVKGEGEDPGPAPLQSSEGPEAGAHV